MITKISRSLFFVAIIIGMIANRASNTPGASENKTESDRSSCQFKNVAGDLPDEVGAGTLVVVEVVLRGMIGGSGSGS